MHPATNQTSKGMFLCLPEANGRAFQRSSGGTVKPNVTTIRDVLNMMLHNARALTRSLPYACHAAYVLIHCCLMVARKTSHSTWWVQATVGRFDIKCMPYLVICPLSPPHCRACTQCAVRSTSSGHPHHTSDIPADGPPSGHQHCTSIISAGGPPSGHPHHTKMITAGEPPSGHLHHSERHHTSAPFSFSWDTAATIPAPETAGPRGASIQSPTSTAL